MVWVRTSRKITIAAPPARIWTIITDPAQYAALDPRTRLLGAAGEPAMIGSNYTIQLTLGTQRVETTYSVTEAAAPTFYAYDIRVREHLIGQQEVHLQPGPDGGTFVRWSIAIAVRLGSGWAFRRRNADGFTQFMTSLRQAAEALPST